MIELDVPARRLHLDLTDAKIAARLAEWTPAVQQPGGGYAQLYHDRVMGPERGADFDFLVGRRGSAVGKESH